jgi:hypothetical protein
MQHLQVKLHRIDLRRRCTLLGAELRHFAAHVLPPLPQPRGRLCQEGAGVLPTPRFGIGCVEALRRSHAVELRIKADVMGWRTSVASSVWSSIDAFSISNSA